MIDLEIMARPLQGVENEHIDEETITEIFFC